MKREEEESLDACVARVIAQLRRESRLTHKDIAIKVELLGVDAHLSTCENWENPRTSKRVSTLFRAAQVYGVKVSDIILRAERMNGES